MNINDYLKKIVCFKKKIKKSGESFCSNDNILPFNSILEWLDVNQGIKLDEEQ